MGSSRQTSTQSSSSEPWSAAQPALRTGLADAQNLYQSGIGSQVYTGSTVVPFSQQTMQGMNSIQGIANANMNGRGISGAYQDIIGNQGFNRPQMQTLSGLGGFAGGGNNVSTGRVDQLGQSAMNNPAMQGYQNAAGGGLNVSNAGQLGVARSMGRSIPGTDVYQSAAGGGLGVSSDAQSRIGQTALGPSYSEQNLARIAQGNMLNRKDPNFERALNAASNAAQDQISLSASGAGRYGSAMHQGNIAREIGDLQAGARVSQYNQERQNQMAANQLLDSQRMAGLGMGLNAANSAAGIQQANQQMRMAGANALTNTAFGASDRQLNALNAATGIQQGNVANQMAGIQGMGGTYANSIGQALGAAGQSAGIQQANNAQQMAALQQLFNAGQAGIGNLSTAYQGMMQPRQDLMNIGSMYEDLAGRQLNDQLRIFDAQQNAPWEQLGRLNAIAAGAGQMGGTSTGTAQTPGQSPFATGLGYASSGIGILGGLRGLGMF